MIWYNIIWMISYNIIYIHHKPIRLPISRPSHIPWTLSLIHEITMTLLVIPTKPLKNQCLAGEHEDLSDRIQPNGELGRSTWSFFYPLRMDHSWPKLVDERWTMADLMDSIRITGLVYGKLLKPGLAPDFMDGFRVRFSQQNPSIVCPLMLIPSEESRGWCFLGIGASQVIRMWVKLCWQIQLRKSHDDHMFIDFHHLPLFGPVWFAAKWFHNVPHLNGFCW